LGYVLCKLLSGSSCRLRPTGKTGEFTGDSSLLPTFRTLLAEAGKAGARDGWRPRPRGSSDCVVTAARQARYIPGGIWETSRRVDRTERVLAEPAKAKIGQRTLLRLQQLRYAHAPLGVMRPRMQLSFLSNCDDVSLPALKLDPDTEIARVVPADVEVRQRAVLHDVEVMTASSVSRYLECIAISAPPPALSRRNAATLLRAPLRVGRRRCETLRAPGRGSPTRRSTNERLGSRTAHGNGTAFSAVAPSERPVLRSIDPIFGSGIPPGPNSHPTFWSLIRFRVL
jgi:hypothetical protein